MKTRLLLPLLLLAAGAHASFEAQIRQAEQTLEKDPEQASAILPTLAAQTANMNDSERGQFEWLQRRFGFTLDDVSVDREQDTPEVCLYFNRAVQPQPQQDWAAKVTITPAPDGGLRYAGDNLCFSGQWAKNYRVQIDGSLQSDNRVSLGDAVERDIATGNRYPMLRFAAQGNVLSLGGEQHIALESTNVDTVRMQLWFFPREGLANETLRGALLNPQAQWGDFKLNSWMEDRAGRVFSGAFDVARGGANRIDASTIRFADMFADKKPDTNGFYLLNVWDDTPGDNANEDDNPQTLVFTLSKAGLSAYRTEEGLWIEARDLADTNTLAGLDLALYAKSGALIAKAKTDEKGMAHFSRAQTGGTAGDAPAHVIAESTGKDYGITYLTLEGQGFDLADKGLQGERAVSPLRYWGWLDRGVYRPGETVHGLWVVKNRDLSAYNTPLWLTVQRPDGVALESRSIEADAGGAYRMDYALAADAALGQWTVGLRLGRDGEWVARDTVRVDSIMPQILEAKLARDQAPRAGENTAYTLQADWLYGAPAADVRVEASYRLGAADSFAGADWDGWQIGRHDENTPADIHNIDTSPATDADGKAQLPLALPESRATRPQSVRVSATLTPHGGRPLTVHQEDRITRALPYVALKSEGTGAQIALVNDRGELQEGSLNWTLYNLDYHYYWYRQDGEWQIRENVTRTAVENGTLQTDSRAPSSLNIPAVDDYRPRLLEVGGKDPLTAASIHLGYRPDGNGVAPDRIRFAGNDHPPYRKGDKVQMRLFAPFDGQGSVHLATDGIIDTIPVTFRDGAADVSFNWQQWDGGVWLLASGYNSDQSGARNRRAVGLTWLAADTAQHRLELSADIPDTIEPGGELALTFHGEGWVNVAVIDDGLYQLARATFSDPLNAFFGKKRLPLSLYDVWGGVIRQLGGDALQLRSGAGPGDEEPLAALADLPGIDMRNFIRFWSNPVVMENGKTSVSLPIPEGFNGRLRVMAANHDGKRFGHLEKTLTVRAPLVTELRTPGYLTVGDRGEFLLRLHNTTDAAQTVKITVSGEHLQLGDVPQDITLEAGKAELIAIPFTVQTAGDTQLTAHLDSGGKRYTQSRALTLRGQTLPHYLTRYTALAPGKTLDINLPARSIVRPSAALPWSADALAEELRRYPYTCSEQITSRLTVSREDARLAPQDAGKQAVFRDQYNTLLNRQARHGAFSLWQGGYEELWLSAYAGETVLAEGGEPPYADGTPQERLIRHLRGAVLENRGEEDFHRDLPGIAYAHLLLARNGADLRGALQNDSERLPKVLPLSPDTVNLALAFAEYGDGERAAALMQRIDPGLDLPARPYGSTLAQQGELLVRLQEWQQAMPDKTANIRDWQESLIKRIGDAGKHHLSTQEQSWLLRAARLYDTQEPRVTMNGEALDTRRTTENAANITLHNPGKARQYVAISELHYPPADKAESQGWSMGVQYSDFGGKTLDPKALPLYGDILVRVSLTRNYGNEADIILTCPLPAGVQAADLQGDPLAAFAGQEWHDKRSHPQMAENRDDRHIAAFRLEQGADAVEHAFVVKAVRAGEWHAPGCQVEDMYQPRQFARDKAQTFTIRKPQ